MGILGCACCLALVASVWAEADRDCANWDVDIFAPPTATWCYIRMYRCASKLHLASLSNHNTGDLAWGVGGKWLFYQTCGRYGKYLQVWRVKVRRDLMQTQPAYSQCNNRVCGCGLSGKCGGKKPAENFGWRYKDRFLKTKRESKRQFSLPRASRGDQWEDLCLERAVPIDCIKKTTYHESNMASVAAVFKRDVLNTPIDGCRSLTPVRMCMPSGGQKQLLKAQATSKTRGEAQETCKEQGEQECESEEEEPQLEKGEEEEEEPQEGWEEDSEEVDSLKWRWAHNLLPIVDIMVPRTPFEDSWNVPTDRSVIVKEFEKKMQDPEAAAKQYATRAVEFAHVVYPDQRRTFANYTEALDWLVQEEYI